MKSRLTNLADKVVFNGIEYKINTDFKVWIKIEALLFDTHSDPLMRLAEALALAYPILPQSPYDGIRGIMWFYSGEEQAELEKSGRGSAPPCYDLSEDFDYIWGGFMAQYGIDLTETKMHWWKFKALLACLDDNCKFSRIVAFRTADTSLIRDKELKRYYERMKRHFRLHKNQSGAMSEMDVASCFEGLF